MVLIEGYGIAWKQDCKLATLDSYRTGAGSCKYLDGTHDRGYKHMVSSQKDSKGMKYGLVFTITPAAAFLFLGHHQSTLPTLPT